MIKSQNYDGTSKGTPLQGFKTMLGRNPEFAKMLKENTEEGIESLLRQWGSISKGRPMSIVEFSKKFFYADKLKDNVDIFSNMARSTTQANRYNLSDAMKIFSETIRGNINAKNALNLNEKEYSKLEEDFKRLMDLRFYGPKPSFSESEKVTVRFSDGTTMDTNIPEIDWRLSKITVETKHEDFMEKSLKIWGCSIYFTVITLLLLQTSTK